MLPGVHHLEVAYHLAGLKLKLQTKYLVELKLLCGPKSVRVYNDPAALANRTWPSSQVDELIHYPVPWVGLACEAS